MTDTTQAAALPELPAGAANFYPYGGNEWVPGYTADQMRAYATLALQEAERERDALRLQEQVLRGGIASLAAVLGITDAAQMDWVGTRKEGAQHD